MLKRVGRNLTSFKNFKYFFTIAALSYIWDFTIRFENRYYQHTLQYKDFEAKFTDCKKNIPSFMEECKKITHYLSKPIYIRTFVDVLSETKLCGTYTCMDYFFGPDISFAFVGQVIKLTAIVIAIWIIIITVDYIYKYMNREKIKPQIYVHPWQVQPVISYHKNQHERGYNMDTKINSLPTIEPQSSDITSPNRYDKLPTPEEDYSNNAVFL